MDLYDTLAKLDLQIRGKQHSLVKIRSINETLKETRDALVAENAATEKRIQEKMAQEQNFLSQRQKIKMELESLKKEKDEYFLKIKKLKNLVQEEQARKDFLKTFHEKKMKELHDIYERNHTEYMSMPHIAAYEESKKKVAELKKGYEEKQAELTRVKKELEVRNNVEKEIWKSFKNICIQAAENWKKKKVEEEERQKKKEEEEKKQLELEKRILLKRPAYELPQSFMDKYQSGTKLPTRPSWIPSNKIAKFATITPISSMLKTSNNGNKTPTPTYKLGDFANKWKELQYKLQLQRDDRKKRFKSHSLDKDSRPSKVPRLDNVSVVQPLAKPFTATPTTPRKTPIPPVNNNNNSNKSAGMNSTASNEISKNGAEKAMEKLQNETKGSKKFINNYSPSFGSPKTPEKTPNNNKSTLPPPSPRKSPPKRKIEEFSDTTASQEEETSFDFYENNGFTQENEDEQSDFNLDGSENDKDESMSFEFPNYSNSGTNDEDESGNSDQQNEDFEFFNYSSSGYGADQAGCSNDDDYMDTDGGSYRFDSFTESN